VGASVGSVVLCALSDQEKRLIASGNIERIMEGIDYAI
jgi:hypothetical protein